MQTGLSAKENIAGKWLLDFNLILRLMRPFIGGFLFSRAENQG